jgi:hypothetical protein
VNHLSTLPTTGEQARHALLLLGTPAPARLVVEVHAALFDGDLSMTALARLLRDAAASVAVPAAGRGAGCGLCAALRADLTAAPGLVALAEWSLDRRIVTPAERRAADLTIVLRVAEFVAMRSAAGRAADRLLRQLAERVPHGVEAVDLADAARAALAEPELVAKLAAEAPDRSVAARRAGELAPRQQLFGVPVVPQQRGGA